MVAIETKRQEKETFKTLQLPVRITHANQEK